MHNIYNMSEYRRTQVVVLYLTDTNESLKSFAGPSAEEQLVVSYLLAWWEQNSRQSPLLLKLEKFARHRQSLSAVSLRHARSLATIEPRNQSCQLNGHQC